MTTDPYAMIRAGVQPYFNAVQAAAMLGVKRHTVVAWIHRGLIAAVKDPAERGRRYGRGKSAYWRIHREALLKFIKAHGDWDIGLYRIVLQPEAGRLMLVSKRPALRAALAELDPLQVGSLFALGGLLTLVPAWCVVIDFAMVGREWAYDAAERMARSGDHPYLVGIAGEDDRERGRRRKGLWDVLLQEPSPPAVAHRLAQLRILAGAAAPKFHTPTSGQSRPGNLPRRK